MIEMEKKGRRQLAYTIWVEKYRPGDIQSTILPASAKKYFNKLVKDKEFQSLLFHSSSPGVGKTTVAKALCSEIGADYIYINTSKENGIDTLRTKIDKFATSMSLSGGKKVVILDEFDGATTALQQALRASIEEFHSTCRFIFTCNYITKIIDPIKSRCQVIDFNFTNAKHIKEMKPKIVKRVGGILQMEKVTFDNEVLEKLVESHYPDIRRILSLLQQYAKETTSEVYPNGVIDEGIFNCEAISDELIDLIIGKKFRKAREFVISMNYNYTELYRFLYDNLVPKLTPTSKQGQAIQVISEFMWRQSQGVIDEEINFAHCMIELMGVL